MTQTPNIVERPQFPILGSNGATIDWQLVADHGGQANKNHYQTVKRLAERGGLSWSELHAVLHNRPWQKMDDNTAIIECRALEAQYLNADTIEALRSEATVIRLTRELGESRDAEAAEIAAWLRGPFCQMRRHPEDKAFARMIAAYITRHEHRKELSHD